ncbi:MAG TPA: hypothetical protein ENJ82_16415 [Bacteroidetes bacterium]|nr:hypothetical protein [Bacteroidota bacterium]
MKNYLFIFLTMLLLSTCGKNTVCRDTNCEDYHSQIEAQAAFDADPECRADLDHDKDGKACEQFSNYYNNYNNGGGGGSGCPTTANCGCSGHNKSQCQADPCCRWVVGSGCKCA